MPTTLPLKSMTKVEKLRVMEELWADLTKDDASFESPAWHREVLEARKKLHAEGKAHFSPWSEAKARIRRRVRAS